MQGSNSKILKGRGRGVCCCYFQRDGLNNPDSFILYSVLICETS